MRSNLAFPIDEGRNQARCNKKYIKAGGGVIRATPSFSYYLMIKSKMLSRCQSDCLTICLGIFYVGLAL